jgi:hypothetical protein
MIILIRVKIEKIALINDAIPAFVNDSVYIPQQIRITDAKNDANAKAKSDAAKAVTLETLKAGMEAAVKGVAPPAVPVNAGSCSCWFSAIWTS